MNKTYLIMFIVPSLALQKIKKISFISGSNLDDVDLFTGGLAETPVPGGVVGPTFSCIIGQQFHNIKFGDRFWYQNTQHEGAFTLGELRTRLDHRNAHSHKQLEQARARIRASMQKETRTRTNTRAQPRDAFWRRILPNRLNILEITENVSLILTVTAELFHSAAVLWLAEA